MTEPRLLSSLAARSVADLHGVGEKKFEALGQVGIESVLDLLTYYPRRYIDRTQERAIDQLVPGDEAMVLARVEKTTGRRMKNGRMLTEVKISDGSGVLYVTFFNQPWRMKQLLADTEAVFFGKVDVYRNKMQMTNPIVDLVGNRTGRIVPVYPQSEKAGLSTYEIAEWEEESLRRAGEFADPLSAELRTRLKLRERTWALRNVHTPEEVKHAFVARHRLAFDELLRLQTILVLRKRAVERESQGLRHEPVGRLTQAFADSLPFPLTNAQIRSIGEVGVDMQRTTPMHRLLQGDVGSGKTMVAVTTLLMAVQSGHQGALMAPTEVLAEQHFLTLRGLLADLTMQEEGSLLGDRPLSVQLLTNRTTAAERRKLHAGLLDGTVDILVGTHALLTDAVAFKSLGAVVIDEQHRFGVEQRAALREKGTHVPDVLVMTATPIPRTAAMTVYGDLDVSVLDELPPGRTPIRTEWAQGPLDEAKAWADVRRVVSEGQQAYVVCPLVEASEKIQSKSANAEFERLQAEELQGLRLGVLHGQMPAAERETTMNAFRNREIDVLVATTVIEVGVDIPNATVMVIEDASRFGIAQLHQLRGRVGRGAKESFCYLLAEEEVNEDAAERLAAMVRTTDGFELAEVDLELRGSGSIMGARQKGRSDLKLASLRRDNRQMVEDARKTAIEIIDADPFLENNPVLLDDIGQLVDEEEAEFLFRS